jgi:16S rRNA (adenine1518-N6/adenine1519-N6)-dimethyltransferase
MDLREEIPALLRATGLRLNTDLGQHYLVDQDVLDAILDIAAVEDTDEVLEIGPGIGVLTRELVQDAKHVTAIELDPRVIPLLRRFVGAEHADKLTVIMGNALQTPFPTEPYKIVANIPYHITSPLLRHAFLQSPVRPSSLTLLIQREVAEKICDTENAGMLTIIVALFGTPTFVTKVPPSCFLPPPKVNSAVLHIQTHAEPLSDPETIEQIFRLTKVAFGQKRKMLRNSLGSLPEGPELLRVTGIDPQRRPEHLGIQEWITLAKTVPTLTGTPKKAE